MAKQKLMVAKQTPKPVAEPTDKPGVYASAAIRSAEMAPFNKDQARLILKAAAVLGAVTGQGFIAEIFAVFANNKTGSAFCAAVNQIRDVTMAHLLTS